MNMKKISMLVFAMVFAGGGAFSFPNHAEAGNEKGGGKKNTSCAANVNHVGVVDQEQCRYDGGLSARINPYQSIWQSFTAGVDGTLTEVDMGFFGILDGIGTLGIYEGEGPTGALLGAYTTPIVCDGGECMIPFVFNVPVLAGLQYTFRFSPGSGIPDPYGVQVGAHNPYHAGTLGHDIAITGTSSAFEGYDAVFTTFVQ